jgi:hypothetical protein
MSNSEPSAIVLQGIPYMFGLYTFRFGWRKRWRSRLVDHEERHRIPAIDGTLLPSLRPRFDVRETVNSGAPEPEQ